MRGMYFGLAFIFWEDKKRTETGKVYNHCLNVIPQYRVNTF